jgi:hypothetical protein
MTDLSPAAQAVLDAFLDTPGCEPLPGWDYKRDIAAALRAAADQTCKQSRIRAQNDVRYKLLAIAAELEISTTENR